MTGIKAPVLLAKLPFPLHENFPQVMPSKEKSPVWHYFNVVGSHAQCRLCSTVLTTTTDELRCGNLERHLRTHRGSDLVKKFEEEKSAWKTRQSGGDAPVVRFKTQPRLNKRIVSAEERKARRRMSNREAQRRRRARLQKTTKETLDDERDITHVDVSVIAAANTNNLTEPDLSPPLPTHNRLSREVCCGPKSESGDSLHFDADSDSGSSECTAIVPPSGDDGDYPDWIMLNNEGDEMLQEIGISQMFVDELAEDPILSRLLNGHTLQAVLEKGSSSSDTDVSHGWRDLASGDVDHPFYNIGRELALKHRDIVALRRKSGEKVVLSERVILFYLTHIAALARCKQPTTTVAVASPGVIAFCRTVQEQLPYATVTGARSYFRYILIPILLYYRWVLAIYDADPEPTVTYFDPLQKPLTKAVRDVIESVLITAADGRPLNASIVDADPLTFNRLNDDFYGDDGGVYICRLAEQFVLHHRRVFLSDFDINGFRRKMLAVCTFLRGAASLSRASVDHRRGDSTHAGFLSMEATTADGMGGLFFTGTVPYSLEMAIVWTKSKHLLHVSLISKGDLPLFSPDVRLLLSREFQNIDQIISAANELNLLDPSVLVLCVAADQDCFGLRNIGEVLTSLRKQFPRSKVGVRIKFSESEDRTLRQRDWPALCNNFDWIYSFKIFFHNYIENECSEEAAFELNRYCSNAIMSPPYLGIFHASVNLTLEVMQAFSWQSGEVEKSRRKKTFAVQHCKSSTWIVDYAKCRHGFRETDIHFPKPFRLSSYRTFTSSRSHLSIFLVMDESDKAEAVKLILTTIPEEVEAHLAFGWQKFSKTLTFALAL